MRQYATIGVSALAAGISDTATALSVTTGHGPRFDPSPSGVALSPVDPLVLILMANAQDPQHEIVYVTAPRSGDTFPTVLRAQEGTTEREWGAGTIVQAGLTGQGMDEIIKRIGEPGAMLTPCFGLVPHGGGLASTRFAAGATQDGSGLGGVAPTTTNAFTRRWRGRWTHSGATANGWVGVRGINLAVFNGDGAGNGGWWYLAEFGASDVATVAGAKVFAGMIGANGGVGTVEPSAITDMAAIIADSTDANLAFAHNDNAGPATKIDLGADFPAHTAEADWYAMLLRSTPHEVGVRWWIRRMNTGHVASGVVTTNIPAPTKSLTGLLTRGNGPTALPVRIESNGVLWGPHV